MKIKINFDKLLRPVLLFSAGLFAVGILMLLIFTGKTQPQYTLGNLRFSLFIKAFMTSVFAVLFTTGYCFIRFKKEGLWLGLFTALSAVINVISVFSFCVVFRAPLGEFTFALMLYSVFVTYMTALIFKTNIPKPDKTSEKKKLKTPVSICFSDVADKTLGNMLLFLIPVALVLLAVFVITLIFGAGELSLYVIPAILVSLFSVVQTLSVGCKYYTNKL